MNLEGMNGTTGYPISTSVSGVIGGGQLHTIERNARTLILEAKDRAAMLRQQIADAEAVRGELALLERIIAAAEAEPT